tara:strand:+ start:2935 stop:3159 length:225 start_codon:yes stop_codon:yes gene_type:complete
MDQLEETQNDFAFLPASVGGGALVRRSQIVGARANGPNEGAIVYTKAGPSIYTTLSTAQLAEYVSAERVDQRVR